MHPSTESQLTTPEKLRIDVQTHVDTETETGRKELTRSVITVVSSPCKADSSSRISSAALSEPSERFPVEHKDAESSSPTSRNLKGRVTNILRRVSLRRRSPSNPVDVSTIQPMTPLQKSPAYKIVRPPLIPRNSIEVTRARAARLLHAMSQRSSKSSLGQPEAASSDSAASASPQEESVKRQDRYSVTFHQKTKGPPRIPKKARKSHEQSRQAVDIPVSNSVGTEVMNEPMETSDGPLVEDTLAFHETATTALVNQDKDIRLLESIPLECVPQNNLEEMTKMVAAIRHELLSMSPSNSNDEVCSEVENMLSKMRDATAVQSSGMAEL